MARIVEILVGISALAGIATFLGFRAMARKAVRTLGRSPGLEESNTEKSPASRTLEKGSHES